VLVMRVLIGPTLRMSRRTRRQSLTQGAFPGRLHPPCLPANGASCGKRIRIGPAGCAAHVDRCPASRASWATEHRPVTDAI